MATIFLRRALRLAEESSYLRKIIKFRE